MPINSPELLTKLQLLTSNTTAETYCLPNDIALDLNSSTCLDAPLPSLYDRSSQDSYSSERAGTQPGLSIAEFLRTLDCPGMTLSPEIEKYSNLQSGWDGYGAAPLSLRTLSHAQDFLVRVKPIIPVKASLSIDPTADDAVCFILREGCRKLMVMIYGDSDFLLDWYGSENGEELTSGESNCYMDGVDAISTVFGPH